MLSRVPTLTSSTVLAAQAAASQTAIDALAAALKFIFSWVVLMPIAVIVSGKLIAQTFKLPRQNAQLFSIKVPRILVVTARNDEVTFGFTAFLVNLFATALIAGKSAYEVFKENFGLDLGQFDSLAVFCSFQTVVVSVVILSASKLLGLIPKKKDAIALERDRQVEAIAQKVDEVRPHEHG